MRDARISDEIDFLISYINRNIEYAILRKIDHFEYIFRFLPTTGGFEEEVMQHIFPMLQAEYPGLFEKYEIVRWIRCEESNKSILKLIFNKDFIE